MLHKLIINNFSVLFVLLSIDSKPCTLWLFCLS